MHIPCSFFLTCSVDRCVCWDSNAFSCSEGYALYRCSYSQSRRICTDSFGRLPLRLLLPEPEEERSKGMSMLSSSSVSLPEAATTPSKGQRPAVNRFHQQGTCCKTHLFWPFSVNMFSQPLGAQGGTSVFCSEIPEHMQSIKSNLTRNTF